MLGSGRWPATCCCCRDLRVRLNKIRPKTAPSSMQPPTPLSTLAQPAFTKHDQARQGSQLLLLLMIGQLLLLLLPPLLIVEFTLRLGRLKLAGSAACAASSRAAFELLKPIKICQHCSPVSMIEASTKEPSTKELYNA